MQVKFLYSLNFIKRRAGGYPFSLFNLNSFQYMLMLKKSLRFTETLNPEETKVSNEGNCLRHEKVSFGLTKII